MGKINKKEQVVEVTCINCTGIITMKKSFFDSRYRFCNARCEEEFARRFLPYHVLKSRYPHLFMEEKKCR